MKNFIMTVLEICAEVYNVMAKHPIVTTVCCGLILGLHVVLNLAFYGREMPNGIILQPWMAVVNCISMGVVTGSCVGYVAVKGVWKK